MPNKEQTNKPDEEMRSIKQEFLKAVRLQNKIRNMELKGVLHPRLVFGLFLHFSQKLQHIGNK